MLKRLALLAFFLVAPVAAQVPISALPPAAVLTGNEVVPVVQGGVTKRSTTGAVAGVASPVGPQSANIVLAGPASGSASTPTYRGIVTNDLTGVTLPVANGGTGSASATGATGNLRYLSTLTGAAQRPVSAKLGDIVSVLDFPNCDKTGVLDSGGCIQTAINSGAATILFPAGTYKLTGRITIPTGVCPLLKGAGISSTTIFQTGAAAGGFFFSNAPGAFMCAGGGVQDMTLNGSATPSSAYSTGAAIVVQGGGYFQASNLLIQGWQTGISFDNTSNTYNRNLSLQFIAGNAIEMGKNIAYSAGAGNTWDSITIGNTGASFSTASSVGLAVYASGGEFFRNIDIAALGYGVKVIPATGQQVAYLWFDSVLADTSTNDGYYFHAVNGSYIYSTVAVNSWASFNSGFGLYTQVDAGGTMDGLRWVAGRIRQNVKTGAAIGTGTARVSIQDSEISDNGRTTIAGTWQGINIQPNVKYFHITGNTIGNFAPTTTPVQGSSVRVEVGSSDHFIIGNNICVTPAGGQPCIFNGGTGVDISVAGNVGP